MGFSIITTGGADEQEDNRRITRDNSNEVGSSLNMVVDYGSEFNNYRARAMPTATFARLQSLWHQSCSEVALS
jgi:hypothetical protein